MKIINIRVVKTDGKGKAYGSVDVVTRPARFLFLKRVVITRDIFFITDDGLLAFSFADSGEEIPKHYMNCAMAQFNARHFMGSNA